MPRVNIPSDAVKDFSMSLAKKYLIDPDPERVMRADAEWSDGVGKVTIEIYVPDEQELLEMLNASAAKFPQVVRVMAVAGADIKAGQLTYIDPESGRVMPR